MNSGYKIDYSYYKNNSKTISQGIDYLKLVDSGTLSIGFDPVDIDDDNSNFAIIDMGWFSLTMEKTIVKGSWEWYKFSIDYNGFSTPLFMVRYYRWKSIVDFYGSFFRLIDIQYLPSNYLDIVVKCLGISYNSSISRIDYRLDFFSDSDIKVQKYNDLLKHSINASTLRIWKKWQILTNWQCWDKSSKAVVFRLYDKLIDSVKKKKQYLYFDYFRFNSVHRLEFECNLKFCRWFTLNDLWLLVDKIHRVFGISENKWIDKILYRYDKNKLVYNRKEIDLYIHSLRKNIQYLTSNYIASNLQTKINPISVVFDYIKDFNFKNDKLTEYIWLEFWEYWKKYLSNNKWKMK